MEVSGEITVFEIDWDYTATWIPRQKATRDEPEMGGYYDDVSVYLQGICVDRLLRENALNEINNIIQDIGEPEDTEERDPLEFGEDE
jgi:hypothetical protein